MSTKKVLICDACDRESDATEFAQKLAVERVNIRFSSGGGKPMDLCGMHLQTLLDLVGPRAEQGEDGAFKCTICDKPFASRSGVRYHMESEHGDPKAEGSKGRTKRHQPMKCPDCGKTFLGPQGLAAHIRTTHPKLAGKKITADGGVEGAKAQPKKKPAKVEKTEEGKTIIKMNSNGEFVCPHDGLTYDRMSSIRNHWRRHHRNELGPLTLQGES